MQDIKEFSFNFGKEPIKWYYKKFTRLSDSSIFAKWGKSAVNVTILRGEGQKTAGFFPLQVEYLERLYAVGRIASSPYVKREGHPSDSAVLKARVIDRAIRPRFPSGLVDTVQVFVNVLSYDPEFDPMILGFNTVVAALMASDIPFNGPLAGVRVSIDKDGKLFINNNDLPLWDIDGHNVMQDHKMNLVMAVEPNGIVMFDAVLNEIQEDVVKDAMRLAIAESEPLFEAQKAFAKEFGVPKEDGVVIIVPADLVSTLDSKFGKELKQALSLPEKEKRVEQIEEIQEKINSNFYEEYVEENSLDEEQAEEFKSVLERAITKLFKKYVRDSILKDNIRIDGRDFDQVRDLGIEVGVLPRAHGSGVFSRGETEVLSIVTLASLQKQLQIEEITGDQERRYIHEYYSPPYAFGQPGRIRYYPGRREVGHGALAEKALLPVIPDKETFPYTIRVVSEVMSSAGSTSMASVCGSTLALMDAGVPITKPVAGISIGVIVDEDGSYKLLTDIQELEDFYGEMDFKVAGTKDGITAIQMDQKRGVLAVEIFDEALEKAKSARMYILEQMANVINGPRESLSDNAPAIETIQIDVDDIGKLIGPGGKMIKEISKESGAELYIEEDGKVFVTAPNKASMDKAKSMINQAIGGTGRTERSKPRKEYKEGEVYEVEVVDLKPFGAIVKILDGTDSTGLIHISEIADTYIKDINTVLKVGQKVRAKIIEVDQNGRIRLSIKQV